MYWGAWGGILKKNKPFAASVMVIICAVYILIAGHNVVFAQNNQSSSSSYYDVIKDIVVPFATFGGGLVGGYYLNARANRNSKEHEDIDAKRKAYKNVIYFVGRMIDNPRFLHGTEMPEEFRKTLRKVEVKMIDHLRQDQQLEYNKFKDEVPNAATQDCEKRKEFAMKGKEFLNSLIEDYNLVVQEYNRVKGKNKEPERQKETRNLSCVQDPDTRDIVLKWN
jgi:hypothetical protein